MKNLLNPEWVHQTVTYAQKARVLLPFAFLVAIVVATLFMQIPITASQSCNSSFDDCMSPATALGLKVLFSALFSVLGFLAAWVLAFLSLDAVADVTKPYSKFNEKELEKAQVLMDRQAEGKLSPKVREGLCKIVHREITIFELESFIRMQEAYEQELVVQVSRDEQDFNGFQATLCNRKEVSRG